jgi:hypothetical protein
MVNPYRPDALIERHVLAAERLHGDDTTVPILAKGKTVKGHIWVYVRDDRPFGGRAPPAALYYASRDRRHEHPARHLAHFSGILQADAHSGYNGLYDPSRSTGPIIAALCWAHARRQFFELVDIGANARRRKGTAAISPLALEAVKRIDALFDIERGINGLTADERLRIRRPGSSLQGQTSVILRLRSSDVLLINSLVLRTTAPTRWPASNWIPRCPFSASTSGAKKIHGRQKAGRDSLDFGPVFPSS